MKRVIAVLALCVLAVPANAIQLDPDSPNGIAGWWEPWVVSTTGEIYMRHGYNWLQSQPLPAPIEDVVDWTPWQALTVDGVLWVCEQPDASGDWFYYGQPGEPLPPPCWIETPTEDRSLGDVKKLYR